MEDSEIIRLYCNRDEQAVEETEKKYGSYCFSIAKNILGNELGITASRGKWVEKKDILYMPTWHPAALLRDEAKKIDFWKDLKEVKQKADELRKG